MIREECYFTIIQRIMLTLEWHLIFFPVTFLSSYLSQKSELQFPDNTQLYYHSLKVYNTEWLLSDCHQGDYNNIWLHISYYHVWIVST